eukprot:gnl/TRDRNA2_/TRDRNA2_175426_c2_seq22.p1 gnl/TRDRNA2_/TRDRNA2_175426_c2~~gnl/TRDRNA2_/TRDRNA2_175426_c2_seq22.p1  ORF type:complete len:327 (-),score=6.38 gnl/TRDRNA2_/TRDRNA2_175426_c2_seq22:56-1036(-)
MKLHAFSVSIAILNCNLLPFLCYFSQGLRLLTTDHPAVLHASDNSKEEQSDERVTTSIRRHERKIVENKQGQGAIHAAEVKATLGQAIDASITPGDKITALTGLSHDHFRNVILMVGKGYELAVMGAAVNGVWLLMPDNYDYSDVGRYRESRNAINYYRIAIMTLCMQSTLLGLSRIEHILENPKNSDIVIPYFPFVFHHLNLSDNWQLVLQVKAKFGLTGLVSNYNFIRDGDTLHMVEVYNGDWLLGQSSIYQLYYGWSKRALEFACLPTRRWTGLRCGSASTDTAPASSGLLKYKRLLEGLKGLGSDSGQDRNTTGASLGSPRS